MSYFQDGGLGGHDVIAAPKWQDSAQLASANRLSGCLQFLVHSIFVLVQ